MVGYYGGFRSCELKSLKFENCELDDMGYWFSFSRSKQRSILEESSICVPRRQADWGSCVEDSSRRPIDYDPASLIDLYFEQLTLDFGCPKEDLKGPFFKGCHGKEGKRFTNVNVGKNTLGYFGVEIASELLLAHPETYTGHCWRRSAGTNASNAGINVTTLMSIMGWSCPKTAMEYVKHSRTTSLQMSMYLTTVQRQNCSVPFPSNASERRRKTVFPALREVPNHSSVTHSSELSLSQEEEPDLCFDDDLSVQEESKTELKVEKCRSGDFGGVQPFNNSVVASDDTNQASLSDSRKSVSSEQGRSTSPRTVSHNVQMSGVESRISNILQNMNNHGNVHIHFHYDKQ